MKDYFKERYAIQERDLPDKELREKLLLAKKVLQSKLDSENKKLVTDTAFETGCIKTKADDFNKRFRNQAQKKQDKLILLKEQYAHLQGVYVDNLKTLEAEYDRIMMRTDGLDYKRTRESESFIEEIISLKQRVLHYEEYIKKLKDLVDKDRAEELIDELSSNEDKRADLLEIKAEILKLKSELGDAKNVRF